LPEGRELQNRHPQGMAIYFYDRKALIVLVRRLLSCTQLSVTIIAITTSSSTQPGSLKINISKRRPKSSRHSSVNDRNKLSNRMATTRALNFINLPRWAIAQLIEKHRRFEDREEWL